MSSKSIDKKVVHFEVDSKESSHIKNVVIPFSLFFRKPQKFIYSGQEEILFKNRHPLYKSILLNEFRD